MLVVLEYTVVAWCDPDRKEKTNMAKSRIAVITAYFKEPGESLKDFSAELKKLTPEDKDELAVGAARNMGLDQTADMFESKD